MKKNPTPKKVSERTEVKQMYDYQEPDILHKKPRNDPDGFWDGESVHDD